jgi:chorismate mutase
MTGIDKIDIEILPNGSKRIRFVREISPELKALYERLGTTPQFKNEIALEIELTEAEYHGTFIQGAGK